MRPPIAVFCSLPISQATPSRLTGCSVRIHLGRDRLVGRGSATPANLQIEVDLIDAYRGFAAAVRSETPVHQRRSRLASVSGRRNLIGLSGAHWNCRLSFVLGVLAVPPLGLPGEVAIQAAIHSLPSLPRPSRVPPPLLAGSRGQGASTHSRPPLGGRA